MNPKHAQSELGRAPFIRLLAVGASLLAIGVIVHYLFGHWYKNPVGHSFGPDESFITYRYAQNLAKGWGPNWNFGERVEGYSAVLHLLIATVAARFFPFNIFEFCIAFNYLFVVCTLYLYLKMARIQMGEGFWFPVFFISLNPSLWLWTASGFETPLVAGTIFLLWYACEQTRNDQGPGNTLFLCALGVTAVLMHVDGFVNPLIAALYLIIRSKKRAAMALVFSSLGVFVLQVCFRLSYYGYPLNNPFYLKIDGPIWDRILSGITTITDISLGSFWLLNFLILAISLCISLLEFIKTKKWEIFEFYDFLFVLWMGYFLYIGGDYLYERMLLSFIFFVPFATLRITRKLSLIPSRPILAGLIILNLLPLVFDGRFHYHFYKRDLLKEVGIYLSKSDPNAVIAVEAAGKIPFYSGLRSIDLLGYNDSKIAHSPPHFFEVGHSKYDYDYVFKKSPDLLAIFIDGDLESFRGLTRKLYLDYDYHFYLLGYTGYLRSPDKPMIMNVEKKSNEELKALARDNWNYAILKKSR